MYVGMPISGRSHRIVLQIPRFLDYGNEASLWLQDARFDNKQIIRISCILQFSSLEFANSKNH